MSEATAIILNGPRDLAPGPVSLDAPTPGDVVVETRYSGISTGTEKLFWTGEMPPFPGMGYPLIPGYESVGEVVEVNGAVNLRPGDQVFVPGASCYGPIRGLFGAASSRIITPATRVTPVDAALGADATLLALAATARHAIAGIGNAMPELIVGHGVLGRLIARLTIAADAPPPVVWETNPARRNGADGYEVIDPETDDRRDYSCIYDASGNASLLNLLITRLSKGGEIVLAGFYSEPLSFAFPPAFMKEARLRIAAEWNREDMTATRALVDSGALSLADLITHRAPIDEAPVAYETAFNDPTCLKMLLNWEGSA